MSLNTTEVKETFKVKLKVREHPNASKYPGRPCFEINQSKLKFLGELSSDEYQRFFDGSLIIEEDYTAEFFDSILPGDVVGLALVKGINELNMNPLHETAAYKLLVLDVDKQQDILKCRNVTWEQRDKSKKRKLAGAEEEYIGQEVEVAFEDVSVGLGMGFAEILEREGKPFGVPEEVEQEVVIVGKKTEEAPVTNVSAENTEKNDNQSTEKTL